MFDKPFDMYHRIGDWHELADWFTTPIERQAVEIKIRETFQQDTDQQGIYYSPIEFHELSQEDSRVPDGPIGAKLLRGSAKIVSFRDAEGETIINDIDKKDLRKLREITQKIWRKTNPGERRLKIKELDKVINERGTEVIERTLREA